MTKICYFSGTGNTLWSAKKIADSIGGGCELINIGQAPFEDGIVLEADAIVVLFPSYAYGLPVVVRRFLQKAVFKTPYAAALVTFGTSQGGTLAQAARIIRQKNIAAVYYGLIPAVENYIPIFGSPTEETVRKRTAMQREATEDAARRIIERQVNSISMVHPLSSFVSLLFCRGVNYFYKRYKVSESCNGCGICAQMCPVSAVTMRDTRPEFSGKCEHCNGCINWCPQKAIGFWGYRPNQARYHHPEITVAQMSVK